MRHVLLHRWQTLLINGRGQYNCSLAAHYSNSSSSQCRLRGSEQCAPHILHVLPNKIYRLRIASTTALASLNLAIGVSNKEKSYIMLFFHTSFLTFFSSWAKFGRYILRFPSLCYILLSTKLFFEQKRKKFIITIGFLQNISFSSLFKKEKKEIWNVINGSQYWVDLSWYQHDSKVDKLRKREREIGKTKKLWKELFWFSCYIFFFLSLEAFLHYALFMKKVNAKRNWLGGHMVETSLW